MSPIYAIAALATVTSCLMVGGCANPLTDPLPAFAARKATFQERAAPVLRRTCADYELAREAPLVRLAARTAATAGNAAAGGLPAGAVGLALIVAAGDAFCENGPPADDTTTDIERAAWLIDLRSSMLNAALKATLQP